VPAGTGGEVRQGLRSSGSRISGTGKHDKAKNSATDGGLLTITIATGRGEGSSVPPSASRQAMAIPVSSSADQRLPWNSSGGGAHGFTAASSGNHLSPDHSSTAGDASPDGERRPGHSAR
jgi:hypothetical protein